MIEHRLNFEAWRGLSQEDPRLVVEKFFKRYEALTPESQKAFIAAYPDRDELSQRIKAGSMEINKALAGVPYILQDMFDTQGLPTRCGAPFSGPFESPLEENCLLTQLLARHGASYLAKSVPAEFGWSLKGHNASFGDCPHANGLRYICGGGAGSCAHAVADGWAPLAFGLDTCGGIRVPTAFHGLFGFRMENNDYARDGVLPIAPSLDSVGWMNANVEDLLATFGVFYRFQSDPRDAAPRGYLLEDAFQNISSDSKAGLMQLIRPLDIDDEPAVNKRLAATFKPASEALKVIQNRELYSVHQYWIEEYSHYYDPRLLKQIEAGCAYGPSESEEASLAQQNLRASLMQFFRDYDYLVLPVSPLASPEKRDWDDALEEELMHLNAPLSLAFLPALILPFNCGEGKFNAAQFIINPRKMQIVPRLVEQVRAELTVRQEPGAL